MKAHDVGIFLVDQIYKSLMVDEQWSLRAPRGFTWWSYRLAQHIEASAPVFDGDRDLCEIRIWTEIVNNVDPESPVAHVLTMSNMFATLSATVWDPDRRTITDHCRVIVHRQNADWMSRLLPVAAMMQNAATHSRAHALAEAVKGVPAESSHPVSGRRAEADELLAASEQVIAPAGKRPSGFIGKLTRRLVRAVGPFGYPGFAEDTAFTCEMPFTGQRFTPFLMEDGDLVESALLEVYTSVDHPDYGSGALMTLALPLRFPPDDVSGIANRLNALEARPAVSLVPLLGAWSPDPRMKSYDRIAFNSFVPTVLARRGLLENLVGYQAMRCCFAAESLGVATTGAAASRRDGASRGKDDHVVSGRRFEASAKADLAVRVLREAASRTKVQPTEMQAASWRSLVSSRPHDWRP